MSVNRINNIEKSSFDSVFKEIDTFNAEEEVKQMSYFDHQINIEISKLKFKMKKLNFFFKMPIHDIVNIQVK